MPSDAASSRSSQKASVPANAASTFSIVAGASLPAWRRVPTNTGAVTGAVTRDSFSAPGRGLVDDPKTRTGPGPVSGSGLQAKRPGSNEPGSGASSVGWATPAISCASTRAE